MGRSGIKGSQRGEMGGGPERGLEGIHGWRDLRDDTGRGTWGGGPERRERREDLKKT